MTRYSETARRAPLPAELATDNGKYRSRGFGAWLDQAHSTISDFSGIDQPASRSGLTNKSWPQKAVCFRPNTEDHRDMPRFA